MTSAAQELFELIGKDAHATGMPVEHGFVVREGAMARKEIVPSGAITVTPMRQRLISEGFLVEVPEGFRFAKDHHFDSPSGAAAVVLGRTANGWIEWKTATGATLSTVKRIKRDDREPILTVPKRQQIADKHEELSRGGKLPIEQQLDREYKLFRDHFGPQVLAGLDGEPLLKLMHDGPTDSLVHWLEFKSDEEFDTGHFGSIAGGSALKFRIFRRNETGNWQMGGEKANRPRDITLDDAVAVARSHRDQLLKGAELLEALSDSATDEDYALLQDQMGELAPDVSRLAWGHKYFSLLFPEKLDSFHSSAYQRYLLLKMLQLPPDGDGRYICAGRFKSASREVGISLAEFGAVLYSMHGMRHRYWRIGTRSGESGKSQWPMMQEQSCVAVGWQKIPDLSWVTKDSREKLRTVLEQIYPNVPTATGNDVSQITQFVAQMSEGDVVLAADGATILGIGRVTGKYRHAPGFDFPHQRDVEWLEFAEWKLPVMKEGLRTTIREIQKHNENILEVERHIQSDPATPHLPPVTVPDGVDVKVKVLKKSVKLTGVPGRIQSVLERKGQVILYGPPGTGKTYWAERTANDLAALASYGQLFEELSEGEKVSIAGDGKSSGLVRLCCFHPAYGYEDFLEGYRPETVNGQITFAMRDGVFKKLCRDASSAPDKSFYLIVDEINRGDIPRIFGELLTTLEKDKRGKRIILPVSQEIFSIPQNIFLIGTMNTADRSISLLDAALRRRFGFVELMPDGEALGKSIVAEIPLRAWFEALNKRIREHVGRDARNLQIGHSYLMYAGSPLKDMASLKRAIRDDIIPLLEEYCYEKYDTLRSILGDQLVDATAECIRHELFDDGQEDNLVLGLLAAFPDISTSAVAISSEESQATPDEVEDDDEAEEQ